MLHPSLALNSPLPREVFQTRWISAVRTDVSRLHFLPVRVRMYVLGLRNISQRLPPRASTPLGSTDS
jgi:hypothetical protein